MNKLPKHTVGPWLTLSILLLALVTPGSIKGKQGKTPSPVLVAAPPGQTDSPNLQAPPQGPQQVLLDQPISVSKPDFYANQDFEAKRDDYDVFLADDFTNSVSWRISKPYVPGATSTMAVL